MHILSGNLNKKVKILLMLITGIAVCVFTAFLCCSSEAADQIVINEICSNNFSVIYDENGNYADYVELYNPAFVPVSLTGFSLSDNDQELNKCLLDTVIIPPKGYFLIWLDGSGSSVVGHAGFKVSRYGEKIYLSNKAGIVIDMVEIPQMQYNTSYARIQDGMEEWERMVPTAGAMNNGAGIIPAIDCRQPDFSVESGFYPEAFSLEMSAGEGEIIYYTLDGSDPTTESLEYHEPVAVMDASANENVYSARTDLSPKSDYVPPFTVDKATVVRAMAYRPEDGAVSEIHTGVYFVGFDQKEEYNGYPIISLVSDPDNLFDDSYGIYGNGAALEEYKNAGGFKDGELLSGFTDEEGRQWYLYMSSNAFHSGKEWEREAVFTYFDAYHEYCFSQNVGIRISGQSTRSRAQKSFNVYARDIYDQNDVFAYDFFEGMVYSSIKLRNGGSDNEGSKIKDSFSQFLAADRAVAVQDSKPAVVFLNGEYWGIYNIRERYKEDYFENHYGINRGNIWMIDSNTVSIGSAETWNAYTDMLDFAANNDMSLTENYKEFCELVDIQSLVDFYCIQIYLDNEDVSFDKNIYLWRSIQKGPQKYEDCKWRFMLYDLDGTLNDPSYNNFASNEGSLLMNEELIRSLMENKEFRTLFYNTFLEIAATNFNYETVHGHLTDWENQYETQVVLSHKRFISSEWDMEEYHKCIDEMDDFFKKRQDYIIAYLEEELRSYGD